MMSKKKKNIRQNSVTKTKRKLEHYNDEAVVEEKNEVKAGEENLIQDVRQKQRESGLLNVNPEDILNEEERRTNPLCLEE